MRILGRNKYYLKYIKRQPETLYKVFGYGKNNEPYELGYQKPYNKLSRYDVVYDKPVMEQGFSENDPFNLKFSGRI